MAQRRTGVQSIHRTQEERREGGGKRRQQRKPTRKMGGLSQRKPGCQEVPEKTPMSLALQVKTTRHISLTIRLAKGQRLGIPSMTKNLEGFCVLLGQVEQRCCSRSPLARPGTTQGQVCPGGCAISWGGNRRGWSNTAALFTVSARWDTNTRDPQEEVLGINSCRALR